MKRRISVLLAAAAGALVSASGSAQATQFATSPYAAAEIFVGQVFGGDTYVTFCDKNSAEEASQQIGNSSGLFDHTHIEAGSGNDTITILNGSSSNPCAAGLIGAPNYGTKYLDAFGFAGNDTIESLTQGDTHIYGMGGLDFMVAYGPTTYQFGGDDRDRMHAFHWTSSSDAMYGEGGNDCLWDLSGAAAAFDCGTGSDDYVTPAPSNRSGCDNVVGSCNN
jgi:hypothetical protein